MSEFHLLDRLREERPLLAAELRPPRSDRSLAASMDSWIDMYHSIRKLGRSDSVIFLTDNAVGQAEEENLQHLTANLAGEVDPAKVVPFLTCKHSLDYCLLYATRAASHGIEAVTVLGGDRSIGAPRCLPHAYLLRGALRQRVPTLTLGGWANPHRDATQQVDFLLRQDNGADFFLTQIVSHHSAASVERFVSEAERRGVSQPGVFGVFYYRSANAKTLGSLGEFFPVPAAAITRDFESGMTAAEICARSIRELYRVGVRHVYISNLGFRGVDRRYDEIVAALADS
jgi:5,10-methylenetetrahydrofolate reductase